MGEFGTCTEFEKQMRTFKELVKQKRLLNTGTWQRRALRCDQVARWTIPSGYMLFLGMFRRVNDAYVEELDTVWYGHIGMYIAGFVPFSVVTIVLLLLDQLKRMRCSGGKPAA